MEMKKCCGNELDNRDEIVEMDWVIMTNISIH